jgi:hypothetical protein
LESRPDDDGLPVIDDDNQQIGWITHRHVLRTYLKRFGAPETSALKLAAPPVPPAATGAPPPTDGLRR